MTSAEAGGGSDGGTGSQSGGSGGAEVGGTLDIGVAGRGAAAGSDDAAGATGAGLGGSSGAATGSGGMGAVGGTGETMPGGVIVAADGSCLGVSETNGGVVSDATVVHGDCENAPAYSWTFDEDAHLHAAVNDAFLEVNGDAGAVGPIVRVAPAIVPAADNQKWVFDGVQLVNSGGLCIDVPFGNFFDGAGVQVYACNGGVSQVWSVTALGQIRHGSYCFDLPASNTAEGTRIQMYPCKDDESDNQRFVLEHGRLEPRGSGKCLGTAGDPTVEHTALEVQACGTSEPYPVAQLFSLVGPIMNRGQCLDSGSPEVDWGQPVTLEPCTGTAQQTWIWEF